jgi:hypothetical protein
VPSLHSVKGPLHFVLLMEKGGGEKQCVRDDVCEE